MSYEGKHVMKTKILRNILLSVGVLFALARLLAAGTSDGALNFSDSALFRPQPAFITFDASVAELKEEKTLVSELL